MNAMITKYSELNTLRFPETFLTALSPKEADKVRGIEDKVNQVLSGQGKIIAAQYKEINFVVNRSIENFFDKLKKDLFLSRPFEDRERDGLENEAYMVNPAISNMESLAAKFLDTKKWLIGYGGKRNLREWEGVKLETRLFDAMKKAILDLSVSCSIIKSLKEKISKRETPEEREERERFIPPSGKLADVKKLQGVLQSVVIQEHEALVNSFVNHFSSLIKDFDTKPPQTIEEQHNFMRLGGFDELFSVSREGWGKNTNYKIVKKDISEDKIRNMSLEKADYIEDFFLSRSIKKLAPIISGKSAELQEIKKLSARAGSQTITCLLNIQFADGSKFDVKHQAVYVWGYGERTPFVRFPTTFHNVRLSDGSGMPNPSEERMHTVFLQSVTPKTQGDQDIDPSNPWYDLLKG